MLTTCWLPLCNARLQEEEEALDEYLYVRVFNPRVRKLFILVADRLLVYGQLSTATCHASSV